MSAEHPGVKSILTGPPAGFFLNGHGDDGAGDRPAEGHIWRLVPADRLAESRGALKRAVLSACWSPAAVKPRSPSE